MAIRIAINGFGRIGRLVARVAKMRHQFDIVAVNDLGDGEQLWVRLEQVRREPVHEARRDHAHDEAHPIRLRTGPMRTVLAAAAIAHVEPVVTARARA